MRQMTIVLGKKYWQEEFATHIVYPGIFVNVHFESYLYIHSR